MKILIMGASGTIGSAIYERLAKQYEVYGTYNKHQPLHMRKESIYQYDIANRERLNQILKEVRPDWVVSSLTGNHEHQLAAHECIADYLQESKGRCIFLSTANVFDGEVAGAHIESDTPYPISAYGRFKYSCEQMLQIRLGNRLLIARLPRTLSSEDAMNEIQASQKGEPVFSNLYISYNTATHVASAICSCIETERHGIWHLTSDDCISMAEWTKQIFRKKNICFDYTTDDLTVESYCRLLGCEQPDVLRHGNDQIFCLALKSMHKEYRITCEEVLAAL